MIDIGKIREIYPNYQEGQDVSPAILMQSMIVLQNQESQLVSNLVDASSAVDSAKLKLDRRQKDIDYLIDKALASLIHENKIPKDFLKSKELTFAWIKASSSYKNEYDNLLKTRNAAEEQLVEAKSLLKKYETMAYVVKNAINTAIQILSYLKHEERLTHESGRIQY